MCGIAGIAGIECSESTKHKIIESMHRRGPDSSGMWSDNDITLFHDRLAVIDVKNGTQPMVFRENNRTCVIVYNGELYNTSELKHTLRAKKHTFITDSDTEVLLHSYIEWGEDCVHRLNGIYAFTIWDSDCKALFFARDRIGVKPFFFTLPKGGFAFASEIKTLLCIPEIQPEIDADSVFELMLIGPGHTPGSGVFKRIKELKPGFRGWYDKKRGIRTEQYWSLTDKEHTDNLEQTIETVRELVHDSIRRQLVSDVPLCTFLSGGLDSSIISAVAASEYRKHGAKLDTVSVTYRNNKKYFKATHFQPNTDDDYISLMNDSIGAKNHLITIDTAQLVEALYDAVDARDLPAMADVDSSLLIFCREIKKLGTVALSGECADEIFGGYPWYRDKEIRRTAGFPWAQSTDYRADFMRDEWKKYRNPKEYVDERYRSTVSQVKAVKNDTPDNKRIREMTRLNFEWFMQNLLERKDRCSMYSGLEVRVPFCDYRIAEYLYNVPWEWKDLYGKEKGLLREAVKGWIPDEIRCRKKSPYPKTHNPEYLEMVSRKLKEIVSDGTSPIFNIVKREKLEELLRENRSQPWYGQLMTTPQTIAYFIQMDYWMRKYKVVLR